MRATSPRAATSAPSSLTRWAAKHPRVCSASTSTCSSRVSRTCRRSPSTNGRRTTRSTRSSRTASATSRSRPPGRSRCGWPGASGGLGSGRLHDVPRRGLGCPAQLGREGLPQLHLLQRGRQGRPLRRLGGAAALQRRDPRGVPITALAKEVVMSGTVETVTEIRPFHVEISEEALEDLHRRIEATRLPSKELVDDRSQGVQLATIQELARYWANDYDFGRIEARLNALPQFMTEIDGVDIHFIHVRSRHENALPLIMTHGWPGSVVELLDTVGPLTDPTAHGGTADDAFHLVLPW